MTHINQYIKTKKIIKKKIPISFLYKGQTFTKTQTTKKTIVISYSTKKTQ